MVYIIVWLRNYDRSEIHRDHLKSEDWVHFSVD